MMHRTASAGWALCGVLLSSTTAWAGAGNIVGNVNMRTGPGTQFPVITTIPDGAPVHVFECGQWCEVAFGGTYGFVAASFVAGGYTDPAPRPYYLPPAYYAGEEPVYVEPEVSGYTGLERYRAVPGLGFFYPWIVPPQHRLHYWRGDGAYFEFDP